MHAGRQSGPGRRRRSRGVSISRGRLSLTSGNIRLEHPSEPAVVPSIAEGRRQADSERRNFGSGSGEEGGGAGGTRSCGVFRGVLEVGNNSLRDGRWKRRPGVEPQHGLLRRRRGGRGLHLDLFHGGLPTLLTKGRYCRPWQVDGGWWMGKGMGIRAGVPLLFSSVLTCVMIVC